MKKYKMVINSSLQSYIEENIIPQYTEFDKAHSTDHVLTVISESLDLAQHYDVDINMVYTIAAYHDLGISKGREFHHIESGKMLLADKNLTKWFSEEQLAIMKEAVEDHRASIKYDPRSIYGKIVAEADRIIDTETVIRRTIQYGLKHYPQGTRDFHWQRCKEHLIEKYGDNGYLKLWIPYSKNNERLQELRKFIKDERALTELFSRLYEKEIS